MDASEEAAWIRRAQAGDREAFAELVKHYWSRVFRWLHAVSGCAHTAEDLTQETFTKAWSGLPTFKPGAFRGWVFRIARNALIDHQRSEAAKPTEPLQRDAPASTPEPVEQLVTAEHRLGVESACRQLPELVRSAFLLWVREEMPYAEIAAALDITEETARWRVYKARRLLMRILSHERDPKKP